MQFRKKPIVVEAIRIADAMQHARVSWSKLPGWLRKAYEAGKIIFASNAISIATPQGRLVGLRNDWLIRGVEGELYPCSAEAFAQTYEPVESEASEA